MKSIKLNLFGLFILTHCIFSGNLQAETITLQNLYGIAPLDDSPITWEQNNPDRPENTNRITAHIDNQTVTIDFKNPIGNTHIIISRGDGSIYRQHSSTNTQNVTIDMQNAKAGRYMLEVYTDEEAVGGMFEVKK